MNMATNTTIDPIDRSMLRDTMTRTMPVAMMPTAADWTDRFHRFRGDMKRPSDRKLNRSQMTPRATIMPSRRVSISMAASSDRSDRLRGSLLLAVVWVACPTVISTPR